MDATARCLTLAPLLWPGTSAFDVRLSRGADGINALLIADGGGVSVATADDGNAALDALAAQLATVAHDRSDDLLRAAGLPLPCADHKATLAARLAEAERELARINDGREWAGATIKKMAASRDALDHALRALANGGSVDFDALAQTAGVLSADALRTLAARAARVDREPPQRVAGLGAGVAADVVGAWCDRLNAALRGEPHELASEVVRTVAVLRHAAAVAAARQDVRSADGAREAVERGQDAGGAGVERVVVAEGEVEADLDGDAIVDGGLVKSYVANELDAAVSEYRGRRVRIVVEVLRGEGGAGHDDESIATATPSVESPR